MTNPDNRPNPHKVRKYTDKLENMLDKNRVSKVVGGNITHVSMNRAFPGKFFFETNKKLNKLISECNKLGINYGIAEKRKDYGPIIVDIDLNLPKEDVKKGKRLYNEDLLMKTIGYYRDSIKEYLDPEEEEMRVFVFEKSSPSDKGHNLKDGFHLMFPYICAHYKVRHLIRFSVVDKAEKEKKFELYNNSVSDIFDKSVVNSIFWNVYGNCRTDGKKYSLTRIISDDDEELDMDDVVKDEFELIELLSLQKKRWKQSNETPLQAELTFTDIEAECNKKGIDASSKVANDNYILGADDNMFRKAKYLVSLLNEERSENYHDWIRVGWALHNVDRGLLPVWHEFSQKCPQKYDEKECEKKWYRMKDSGYTIRSLMYWAKNDNYHKYSEFIKQEFDNLIDQSLGGDTNSIAKALYTKYFDRFVCASINRDAWFEFRENRWFEIQHAVSLMNIISSEFVDEYSKKASEYNIKAVNASNIEKEDYQKKAEKYSKIVCKLRNISFKKQILEECKYLFYEEKFIEKLDENLDLLGCEDGVYDFSKGEFRQGKPDDYITLSTGKKYIHWNPNKAISKKLLKYLEQVLPHEETRKYFLKALATTLTGHNQEEKLYIMTGSGSNSKSLLIELVSLALGDYYISCPITIMTRKRNSSGQASPELARIKGKRCGVFQEPDNNEALNVGLMKELTGNDKFIARNLFSDPIEIKPQIKFFLTCNELPAVPARDGGTWRRLRVVDFSSKFVDNPKASNEFKIDTKLKQKIQDWGDIFLGYLIHIYNTEYITQSTLYEPPEVKYATNIYKMENDHFTEYYKERIEYVKNPKSVIDKKTLYCDFKQWFKEQHEGDKLPKSTQLYRFMDELVGKSQNSKWKNIMFKNNEESEDEDEETNDLDN